MVHTPEIVEKSCNTPECFYYKLICTFQVLINYRLIAKSLLKQRSLVKKLDCVICGHAKSYFKNV